jgi:hypothetical protein
MTGSLTSGQAIDPYIPLPAAFLNQVCAHTPLVLHCPRSRHGVSERSCVVGCAYCFGLQVVAACTAARWSCACCQSAQLGSHFILENHLGATLGSRKPMTVPINTARANVAKAMTSSGCWSSDCAGQAVSSIGAEQSPTSGCFLSYTICCASCETRIIHFQNARPDTPLDPAPQLWTGCHKTCKSRAKP